MKAFLIVSLLGFSTLALASNPREIREKMDILNSELNSNTYSRLDAERISAALDRVIDLARTSSQQSAEIPMTRPNRPSRELPSNECMSTAYNYGLRENSLSTICRNANAVTPKCIATAYNYGLRNDEIIEGCGFGPSEHSIPCFGTGYNYGLRKLELAGLCGQISYDASSCISTAYNYGLRAQTLSEMCARPVPGIETCIATSYNHGLRQEQIVTACGNIGRRRRY